MAKKEVQKELDLGVKASWGGARNPGKGKKLGPPKKSYRDKKHSKTFSLTRHALAKLQILADDLYPGQTKSFIIEALIHEAWKRQNPLAYAEIKAETKWGNILKGVDNENK